VIGSAVVPTLIAQRWFMPTYKPLEATGVEVERVPDTLEPVPIREHGN
jgi:hypothetical protein